MLCLGTIEHSRVFQLKDLEMGSVLGEGFFGRVYKATHKRTGEFLVVKELKDT